MRIISVTTKLNFQTSGASVVELDLKMRTLMSFGHEVTVITTFSGTNKILATLPYVVIEKNFNTGNLFPIQWKTYKLLKEYEKNADVFFVDGQVFLYGAGLYRLLGGSVPVFAHFNRELGGWKESAFSMFRKYRENFGKKIKRILRNFIEKHLLIPIASRIDYFSFTNPHLRESYRSFGLETDDRSFIAGDAFDWRSFNSDYGVNENSYSSRNKSSGLINFYYSSRMAPGKGFDLLIEGFSKVSAKENIHLILGGAGPEEQDIREMVVRLGLEKFVTFTGWAPKNEHYQRLKTEADIFVQPMQSGLDKTSYILLEAMSFGVPSILPRGGGLEWDARDAAVYFRPGDTNDLAEAITYLAQDGNKRLELSENCYRRLREDEMDLQIQVRSLEKILVNLVRKNGS